MYNFHVIYSKIMIDTRWELRTRTGTKSYILNQAAIQLCSPLFPPSLPLRAPAHKAYFIVNSSCSVSLRGRGPHINPTILISSAFVSYIVLRFVCVWMNREDALCDVFLYTYFWAHSFRNRHVLGSNNDPNDPNFFDLSLVLIIAARKLQQSHLQVIRLGPARFQVHLA